MKVDLFTATGTKKGTLELPASVFEAAVNQGLMHQAVMLQQGNRRSAIAHVKRRGDIEGSTRKLFSQKGTGRARRGSVRANVLKGGNKAFGPTNAANFTRAMPKKMRHFALRSSLSLQAKNGAIVGLESYPEDKKTKKMAELLGKLPVELGRKILIIAPSKHHAMHLAVRNIPRVKLIMVDYLNPEDVLGSRYLIFLADAVKRAEELFGGAAPKKEKVTTEAPKKKAPSSTTK